MTNQVSTQQLPHDPTNSAASIDRQHDSEFWLGWLRTLLWFNLVLALFEGAGALFQLAGLFIEIADVKRRGLMWLTPQVAGELAMGLALPALHLYGVLASFGRKSVGRTVLIIFCWCMLGLMGYQLATALPRFYRMNWDSMRYLISYLHSDAYAAVLPVFTLLWLTRSPMKQLFTAEQRGFDVLDTNGPVGQSQP